MFKKKFLGLSVILLLVLYLGLSGHSCTMAYTWEEFVDYCNLISTGKISNNGNAQKVGAQYVVANKNRIENAISVNDYSTFIIAYDSYYYLQFYTGDVTVYNSSNTLRTSGGTMGKSCKLYSSSVSDVGTTNWINAFSCNKNTAIGLLTGGSWNADSGRSNKQYFYLQILPRTNLTTENLPWYIADAYTGNTYTNVSFEIQDVSNNNVSGDLDIITHAVNMGTQYQILINSIENLINGEDYHIVMRYGTTPIYQTEDFTLEWEDLTPTPTPPSSGGSGDTGICMCRPLLNNDK